MREAFPDIFLFRGIVVCGVGRSVSRLGTVFAGFILSPGWCGTPGNGALMHEVGSDDKMGGSWCFVVRNGVCGRFRGCAVVRDGVCVRFTGCAVVRDIVLRDSML